MTDAELTAILQRELLPGEVLRWSARPDHRRMVAVFGIWLFAVPWTMFALFWEAMALLPWLASSHTPAGIRLSFGVVMPLFGLPFIAVGAGLMATPLLARRAAAHTIYGLTDQRVLKVTALPRRREASSVRLDQCGPLRVRADARGFGTLAITTGTRIDSDGDRVTERFEIGPVADVSRLEGLLLARR